MSDESKELNYKITTTAELAGAQAWADSLEKQIGKAKACKEDYSALAKQLDIVKQSIAEANTAMQEQIPYYDEIASEAANAQNEIDKLANSQKRAGAAAEGATVSNRKLHTVLAPLSQLMPGLGEALMLIIEGLRGEEAAAGEAAAANDEFMLSMGELAVVFLAIQAAVEYWHMYSDAAKEAGEAQTEVFRKLEEASNKAFAAFKKLQDAMAGKSDSPTKQFEDDLDRRKQILEAKEKQDEAARKTAEDQALAAATTPEQKAAVKQAADRAAQDAELRRQADQTEQEAAVRANAQADLDARNKKIQQDKDALGQMPASDVTGRTRAMDDIAKEMDQAAELADYINKLTQGINTQSTVQNINQQTVNQQRSGQQTTDLITAIKTGLGETGGKETAEQQLVIDEIKAAFAAKGGQFQVVLDYLKTHRLNEEQFKAYVESELNALKTAQSRTQNNVDNLF